MYYIVLLIFIICILLVTSLRYHHIEQFENIEKSMYQYVINLDRNAERYQNFLSKYQQHMNGNINRFSAVDGSKLSYENLQMIVSPDVLEGIKRIDVTGKRESDKQLTRGMIGCYMSHLELYKYALKNDNNIIMVFEDDAYIDRDLTEFLQNLNEFPIDWDILVLGYVRIFTEKPYSYSWSRLYDFWGTQAYIINKYGMEKMLRNSYPIINQIDHMMSAFAKQDILKIYAYKSNLVPQNSKYSDVQMLVSK